MRTQPANPLLTKVTLKNLLRRGTASKLRTLDDSDRCKSCGSSHPREFLGEICLHFPGGLDQLKKPVIWVFPPVFVCLDCRAAQFTVPETELKLIQQNL